MNRTPTAYRGANLETAEACDGDTECILKETRRRMTKPLKDMDHGISVNEQLCAYGITVHSIISRTFDDEEYGCEATFIRAQDQEGYPFVIYLDSKGYVLTEEVLNETVKLQDVPLVPYSQLNAMYERCLYTCRGVACFTPEGVSVRMHDTTAKPQDMHYLYLNREEVDGCANDTLEVAVPYPILPLSEICMKPSIVPGRVSQCLEPMRKAMFERNGKKMRDMYEASKGTPETIRNFYMHMKDQYTGIQKKLCILREQRLKGESKECPCDKVCKCGMLKEMLRLDEEIGRRERALQEILGLFAVLAQTVRMYDTMTQKMLRICEVSNERNSHLL